MKRFFSLQMMLAALLLAAPVYADAQLDNMIAKLNAERYSNKIQKVYQNRLLELLPRISAGAPVDMVLPNSNGTTALHNACALSKVEIVRWLVAHGANTNAKTTSGATVAMCISGPNADAIAAIIKNAPRRPGAASAPAAGGSVAPASVAGKTVTFRYKNGHVEQFKFGGSNTIVKKNIPKGYGNRSVYSKTGAKTAKLYWEEWESLGTYYMNFSSPNSGTAKLEAELEGESEVQTNITFSIK